MRWSTGNLEFVKRCTGKFITAPLYSIKHDRKDLTLDTHTAEYKANTLHVPRKRHKYVLVYGVTIFKYPTENLGQEI